MSHAGRDKKLMILMALLVTIALSGCGYSRWQYICSSEAVSPGRWSLIFTLTDVGFLQYVREDRLGLPHMKPDKGDTLFHYDVIFKDLSSAHSRRYSASIEHVTLLFWHGDTSEQGPEIGCNRLAGSFYERCPQFDVFRCGPLRVSIPRPDSISVEQDIVIIDHKTGQEIARRHVTAVGVLYEWRRSSLKEFIEGY